MDHLYAQITSLVQDLPVPTADPTS
jgi:hypothetical protein